MHSNDLYTLPNHTSGKAMASLLLVFIILSFSNAEVFINQFAVHIKGGHHVAERVARETGFINLGQIGSLEDHYLFEIPNRVRRAASPSEDHHAVLNRHEQVHWFEQQVAKSRTKRDFHPRDVSEQMSVLDPYWRNQWYLNGGAAGGFDMNVMEAWQKGYTGKNIVVTILDDGLERDHPDLIRNYDPYASYDVNNHDNDPMPRYDPSNENRHGTRCAGEVSAEANNTHCSIGIAPDSRIGGIRMLDGEVFDAVEATSLSFNRTHVDIYSASWGPDDDGKVVDGPGKLAKKAFINGIEHGRGGKGSIFVWASGNGGSSQDSCNCDGYANSIYTLSISSTSENGVKPWYLEECSSTLATTYSSGAYNERQIASTDLHYKCTTMHTGTSASAPLAAGIVALILEANNDLTWRDVQYITLMTSRPEPIKDGEWVTNGVGRQVSLRYGYGLMDASAMVNLALVWKNVPPKYECLVQTNVNHETLEGSSKFTARVETNGCLGEAVEVNYLEHVQAVISLTYQRRGNVIIYLTSPMGTRSKLLPSRPADTNPGGFEEWPFLSVHFWGENPRGIWTLEIEDADNSGKGTLDSWQLVFHGTKEQPVKLRNHTTAATRVSSVKPTTVQPESVRTNKTLQSCHSECAGACTGPTPKDCLECKHYRIGPSSMCTADCPVGYYKENKMCFPCENSCATCSGPLLTHCLSCPIGHYIQNQNTCSDDCLPGFFFSNRSCHPCHSSCKECINGNSFCTACSSHEELRQNTCVVSASYKKSHTVALLIVLISIGILVFIGIAVGLVYVCKLHQLCWLDRSKYGKLASDEEDMVEPFRDDPDEGNGIQ